MAIPIDYITNTKTGQSLSRKQLEEIFENEEAYKMLCDSIEKSLFKPHMLQEFANNIKNGNLGPLGSFYPLDKIYINNNEKASGKQQYDGWYNTDCGNMIGKNKEGEIQDIASTIISFVLFMGNNNITNTMLLERFKNFILNPPDNYKIELGTTFQSPLKFAGTGIGGQGELLVIKNSIIVGKLQINKGFDKLFDKLEETKDNLGIVELLLGNVGMLWALGMPESYKLNNNEDNIYYWGPEKLIEYGIIKCN